MNAFHSFFRRARDLRQDARGFTLVEVVITTLLILILMAPMTRLSYSVIRSTQYAHDLGEALAAGQSRMEVFEKAAFEDIESGSEQVGRYDLDWTVTEEDGNKVVELDVVWSILGKEITLELNTVHSPDVTYSFTLPTL